MTAAAIAEGVGSWANLGLNIAGAVLSGEEAGENRRFLRRATNFAWRRTVRDLEAAGLNPLIALGAGPTRMGGSPSMPDLSGYGRAVGSAASSARETAQAQVHKSELMTQRAQREVLAATAKREANNAALIAKQADLLGPELMRSRTEMDMWSNSRYRDLWRGAAVTGLEAARAANRVDTYTGGLLRGGAVGSHLPRLNFYQKGGQR